MKYKKILPVMVIALTLGQTHHAKAQAITMDIANEGETAMNFANIAASVENLVKTISTYESILNYQNLLSNVLGAKGSGLLDIGGQSIGSLMQAANLGMSSINNVRNDVNSFESMSEVVEDLFKNPLTANSLIGNYYQITQEVDRVYSWGDQAMNDNSLKMSQAMLGNLSFSDAQTAMNSTIYTQNQTPSTTDILRVRASRNEFAQKSIVGASLAAATSETNLDQNGGAAITMLATGISSSQDLRGDIKANSAIKLKILEQILSENELLGWLIRMRVSEHVIQESPQYPTTGQTATTTP